MHLCGEITLNLSAIPLVLRKLRKAAWSIYLERRNKTGETRKKNKERRNKKEEEQQNKTSTNATTTAKTWSGSPSKSFPITLAHGWKNEAQDETLDLLAQVTFILQGPERASFEEPHCDAMHLHQFWSCHFSAARLAGEQYRFPRPLEPWCSFRPTWT